jgi:lysyl-tRNA synthetase class 1
MPMYDFINIKGDTTKMSSSKGNVMTVGTLLEVYEPEIVRYLYTGKHNKPIDFSFDLFLTNTYNYFDKAEKAYFENSGDSNEIEKFKLSQLKDSKYTEPIQFSVAANLIQAANGNIKQATKIIKKLELPLNKRSEQRLQLAWNWIQNYAPEEIKFTISESLPKVDLSETEKQIFSDAANLIKKGKTGHEIQQFIYAQSKENELNLKDVFKHAYQLLLNKEKGPRLGNFLTVLDTDFVINRLKLIK